MPIPEKECVTCCHHRPYEGSPRLRLLYAKCAYPHKTSTIKHVEGKFMMPVFAETCKISLDLCGPEGRWWKGRAPDFKVVEEESFLSWDDDEEESESDSQG